MAVPAAMIGSILATIFTGIKNILPSASDLGKVILGDQSKRDASNSEADKAAQDAYAREFSYQLGAQRAPFDIIMDGINRTVRPVMAYGTIGLFVWTCFDPPAASKAFLALERVPAMLWNIMLIIVAFFFTGRMIEKLNWNVGYSAPRAPRNPASSGNVSFHSGREAAVEAPQVPGYGLLAAQASPSGGILDLAGYGPGALSPGSAHSSLPKSRAAGWKNPIASRYVAEGEG